jgi:Cu+-exporting ATPase
MIRQGVSCPGADPILGDIVTKVEPSMAPSTQVVDLSVGGMTCAACAARIEKQLNKLPGVEAVVNLALERAHIRFTPGPMDTERLLATVVRAGFSATVARNETRASEKLAKQSAQRRELVQFWIAAVLTLPLVAQMVFMFRGSSHHDVLPRGFQLLLATPVQLWIGRRFYVGAWKSLRAGAGNMDVLVALGTSMAWLYSAVVTVAGLHQHPVYFEASATVITLVLLGKILEGRAKTKTSAAIESLARLQPQSARLERDGQFVDVPVATLIPGDIFVVRPGEAMPVDGEVVEGESAVNEALLTGEAMPAVKTAGTKVFAGTVNGDGLLRCRARRCRRAYAAGGHYPPGGRGAELEGARPAPGGQSRSHLRSRGDGNRRGHFHRVVDWQWRSRSSDGQRGIGTRDRLPLRPRVWPRRRLLWSARARARASAY